MRVLPAIGALFCNPVVAHEAFLSSPDASVVSLPDMPVDAYLHKSNEDAIQKQTLNAQANTAMFRAKAAKENEVRMHTEGDALLEQAKGLKGEEKTSTLNRAADDLRQASNSEAEAQKDEEMRVVYEEKARKKADSEVRDRRAAKVRKENLARAKLEESNSKRNLAEMRATTIVMNQAKRDMAEATSKKRQVEMRIEHIKDGEDMESTSVKIAEVKEMQSELKAAEMEYKADEKKYNAEKAVELTQAKASLAVTAAKTTDDKMTDDAERDNLARVNAAKAQEVHVDKEVVVARQESNSHTQQKVEEVAQVETNNGKQAESELRAEISEELREAGGKPAEAEEKVIAGELQEPRSKIKQETADIAASKTNLTTELIGYVIIFLAAVGLVIFLYLMVRRLYRQRDYHTKMIFRLNQERIKHQVKIRELGIPLVDDETDEEDEEEQNEAHDVGPAGTSNAQPQAA